MSDSVRVFRLGEAHFSEYGEGPGSATIARLVGPQDSSTMGAYFARFDGRAVEWTVRYDELIVCIEGLFRLRTAEGIHELQPGDALWIGDGTELCYEGDGATVFIAIAPVDWRERIAKASS
jgi:ethanolamine utilization protein EutQ